MSKHDPRVTLTQIREAARRAQALCTGITLEDLKKDWVKVMAFERSFEILGEGIKRLPSDLREKYPGHDWRGAAGLRDIVAHGYDWIEYEVLWDAVRDDFPSLFKTVDQMLADLGAEPPAEDAPDRDDADGQA